MTTTPSRPVRIEDQNSNVGSSDCWEIYYLGKNPDGTGPYAWCICDCVRGDESGAIHAAEKAAVEREADAAYSLVPPPTREERLSAWQDVARCAAARAANTDNPRTAARAEADVRFAEDRIAELGR